MPLAAGCCLARPCRRPPAAASGDSGVKSTTAACWVTPSPFCCCCCSASGAATFSQAHMPANPASASVSDAMRCCSTMRSSCCCCAASWLPSPRFLPVLPRLLLPLPLASWPAPDAPCPLARSCCAASASASRPLWRSSSCCQSCAVTTRSASPGGSAWLNLRQQHVGKQLSGPNKHNQAHGTCSNCSAACCKQVHPCCAPSLRPHHTRTHTHPPAALVEYDRQGHSQHGAVGVALAHQRPHSVRQGRRRWRQPAGARLAGQRSLQVAPPRVQPGAACVGWGGGSASVTQRMLTLIFTD